MSGCKQLKTILLDKTGLNLLISVKLQRTVNEKKGKTWPRGTNSRLPFAVNVTPNLSYITCQNFEIMGQNRPF